MNDEQRKSKVIRWLCVATLALVTSAVAQPSPLVSAPPVDNLSQAEKLERSRAAIEAMRKTHRFAVTRLEAARTKKDIIQVNCVNEKLGSVKQLLKLSEQADVDLSEAAARNDKETVDYLYTKIAIISGRVENLRTEVEGCVGELSQYTGKTVVEKLIDSDIRTDDPTADDAADAVALNSDESSRETPRSPSTATR